LKNWEKDLLRKLVKQEMEEGHDMKTALANITKSDESNFTPQTIRNYYKALSEVA
jgi:hypothetical protein